MVKFGGHIEALKSQGDLQSLTKFLVPYNDIKATIFDSPEEFSDSWHSALKSAEDDFRRDRKAFWEKVFAKISSEAESENVRGAHPGNALQLFVENVHPETAREALVTMGQLFQRSSANSEALRKLVKKYDKHRSGSLSSKLLPILYTSSLYAGQQMIQSGIALLRDRLDDSSTEFQPLVKADSLTVHEISIENRMEEIDWLKRLVKVVNETGLLNQLVAHRGFHHIQDRNDKRPLENSLSAYEIAWTSGVHLCECDIAMTKDEKLVLAHDENFTRLALDSKSTFSRKHVSDLTFRELLGLPLKSGVRPPLLIDVLRSASAISPDAKLVIEIKPGNQRAASALARLLIRHPDLCPSVAMIMSFDAVTMHRLRTELSIIDEMSESTLTGTKIHKRVTSFDHFGTMNSMRSTQSFSFENNSMIPEPRFSADSQPDSIGLSLSTANLDSLNNMNNSDSPFAASPPTPVTPVPKKRGLVPKLMLLTVSDPPKLSCEHRISVDDLSPLDHWLRRPGSELDGVYMQFEKKMMSMEGALHLHELSKRYDVGIWGHSGKDPDDFQTFEWLVNRGKCTYVNTDLPNHFRREIFVRTSSLEV